MSHRREFLEQLPLVPTQLEDPRMLDRWRELEAYRQADLFAEQAWRYQDWDLQFLAAEIAMPQHQRTITCEYVEDAEAPGRSLSLRERIRNSHRLLAEQLLPKVPEVSLVVPLHNQGNQLETLLEAIVQAAPEELEAELVLVDHASQDQTPRLLGELEGDLRSLCIRQTLSPVELLRKAIAASLGRKVLLLSAPLTASLMAELPQDEGFWQVKSGQWTRVDDLAQFPDNWRACQAVLASTQAWHHLLWAPAKKFASAT